MIPVKIAPSLLAADPTRLAEEIRQVEEAGADLLHVDVMDGHLVPNLSMGPHIVEGIRKITKLPLDVHLMVERPLESIEPFAKAGADWLTFHIEAKDGPAEVIQQIRAHQARAGISLRPVTPLEAIVPWLDQIDFVLVMSVDPGFGGQAFIPSSLEKVQALRARFDKDIEIDGGINDRTGGQAVAHGASILVAGTYIFHAPDRRQAIARLRSCGR